MKDRFEKLIDAANAKVALKLEAEQRVADELANAKADAQRLADDYYEMNRPMFEAAISAMHSRGIVASCERRTAGVLVTFDSLKTSESLKRLGSSFEYSYFNGGLHLSEVICGNVPIVRKVAYTDLEDAFVAWMTAGMEARSSRPAKPNVS
jgi:hypothetical protein